MVRTALRLLFGLLIVSLGGRAEGGGIEEEGDPEVPGEAGPEAPEPMPGRGPTAPVVYKPLKAGRPLHLHFYRPERSDPATPLPAIVFFPGGGWTRCDVGSFKSYAEYFASRGMVAAVAEYRVKGTHPSSTIFDCVADGKSAIRWVRAHARELGVDPERIVAAGGSAGGQVAACAGLVAGRDEPGEDAAVSSRPNYLMLFNPVVSFKEGGPIIRRYAAEAAAISPTEQVRPGAPPTVIFHGTQDTTVPIASVARFEERMKAAGNDCVLFPHEGKSHGFYRGPANFAAVAEQADRFLIRQKVLAGEPTVSEPAEPPPQKPRPGRR